ncbi:MAG: hypothetical protein AAF587_35630 [Bacteroidota bacterium]
MKQLFFTSFLGLFLCVLITNRLIGQRQIAVQNGGSPTLFTELDSALIHVQAGDSIFLPGGIFQTSSPLIDKEIHLIGVGHHPDSTAATNFSRILGTIKLVSGADNSSLIGFLGAIQIGTTAANQEVDGVKIESIYGSIEIKHFSSSIPNPSDGLIIRGNILTSILRGGGSSGNKIFNNYISIANNFGPGNIFSNNIFSANKTNFQQGNPPLWDIEHSRFDNNIFLSSVYLSTQVTFCIFNNNLCVSNGQVNGLGGNGSQINQTLYDQPLATIFENVPTTNFSYDYDYHLKNTSLGKSYGLDGTDVGVYGGVFPWKAGNIPFNPHVQSRSISSTTNNLGELSVKVQVSAQNN